MKKRKKQQQHTIHEFPAPAHTQQHCSCHHSSVNLPIYFGHVHHKYKWVSFYIVYARARLCSMTMPHSDSGMGRQHRVKGYRKWLAVSSYTCAACIYHIYYCYINVHTICVKCCGSFAISNPNIYTAHSTQRSTT